MNETKNHDFSRSENSRDWQSQSSDFSAPLGTLKSARLVFASGAQGLELTADPSIPTLYQARFRRYMPRVWVQDSIVTVEYRHFPSLGQLVNLRRPLAAIRLNGSIPWEIEFRNSGSHLKADLTQLPLRSLDILGGANQIRLALSRPSGTTFIYISGGVSQGAIRVPSTAEIRLQVSGGATHLTFEAQRFGAIGGEMSLESPYFESATRRYDICIAGGAGNLTIDRKG